MRAILLPLVAIYPATACSAFAQQTPPAQELAGAQWIPFVAKVVEQHQIQVGQGENVTIPRAIGVQARNSLGLTYQVFSTPSCLPPAAPEPAIATLYDPRTEVTYLIDFQHKTATRVAGNFTGLGEVGSRPTRRERFEQKHAEDLPLGKQVISGVECDRYRIHDPKSKKKRKYMGEEWYAPSLNFLEVKAQRQTGNGDSVATSLEEIQVGKEPDPSLFRIPEGFKLAE